MATFWLGVFLMVFGGLIGIRNNKVGSFRSYLLNLCGKAANKYGDDWRKPYRIYGKHSYYRMLYSFKPLKLEKWFTDDEIKILTHGNDD